MYKIPDKYFFRLHHVRPRFKNDVEEVLLYVANSIANMPTLPKQEFKDKLNEVLFKFKKNSTSTQKTIDNWRTEISALFAFIEETGTESSSGKMAVRLSESQYLDEFFNYFLYSFQYPGGHIKSQNVVKQIENGVRFKPCSFILELLIEGGNLLGKPFSITAEELTQCAYYDLRVTRDGKSAKEVAQLIITNRENKVEYDHKYDQLKTASGNYPSRGDVNRYAGDILDYMVLANLLNHKGTGYYYYLNKEATEAINYHLQNSVWFDNYDKLYNTENIELSEVSIHENSWFSYVNSFEGIEQFSPKLDTAEAESINKLIEEYYKRLKGDQKVPTKIIGDYGESLILAHEYLRTQEKSNRQHLINKIPTPLGVGYDIQSIEFESKKRYIEVKTTKSKKALTNNKFKLTPNEWDTALTIGGSYFIYYLVVNENQKNVFVINDPVDKYNKGLLKVDDNLVVEFSKEAGEWQKLIEIQN
ncbi:MAG: DUF3883 domain-containing protein [Ignavibacteriae bacterium]|nr:DUF3883 domain-containing protein [Ignavibacteriota bacterium]